MEKRILEYKDGPETFSGYLAKASTPKKKKPAVLIAHAWAGKSPFECAKAELLASWGYVGFAADLYGKDVLGTSREENTKLMSPFMENRAKIVDRLEIALTHLKDQEDVDENRVAAIGFCFGGLCVLDLARNNSQVQGVASFHGLLNGPQQSKRHDPIKPRVLVLHGHEDPMVPAQQVLDFQDEMTKYQADWQIHTYGRTLHSFTNPEANDKDFGTVYNAQSSERSLKTLRSFLEEIFSED